MPGVGVTPRINPLITANPTPAASTKDEARAGGECRGKPSAIGEDDVAVAWPRND